MRTCAASTAASRSARVPEDAATAIISRPPPTAATDITTRTPQPPVPYAPPAAYYDYDEPPRRALWTWFVALLFVAAALIGGYFLYSQIQDQLSGSKTIAVGNYVGIREADAVAKINAAGRVVGDYPSTRVEPVNGNSVTLTIPLDYQKEVIAILQRQIDAVQPLP